MEKRGHSSKDARQPRDGNKRLVDGTLLETTWNHPFRVMKADANGQGFSIENTQWKEAKDLLPGDVSLSAAGSTLQILSVEIDQREETVYNFEVEDFHTYFVGEVGVWVHNADYTIQIGLAANINSFFGVTGEAGLAVAIKNNTEIHEVGFYTASQNLEGNIIPGAHTDAGYTL